MTTYFEKHWKYGTITLHGRKVLIDESLIARVTVLSVDGMKYYRDKNYMEMMVQNFPKNEDERAKMVKKMASYYDISAIKEL